MPTPFMCHDCDSPTMNSDGICDNCVEPTTADQYNKEYYDYKEKRSYKGGDSKNYERNIVNPSENNRMDRVPSK